MLPSINILCYYHYAHDARARVLATRYNNTGVGQCLIIFGIALVRFRCNHESATGKFHVVRAPVRSRARALVRVMQRQIIKISGSENSLSRNFINHF